MQSTLLSATADERRTRRGRKVKAVLAGGIVLGLGAAVTLAVWTDNEFVNGVFATGEFVFDGSTDGAAFADHATSPGAPLAFELATAQAMTPGDSVSAPFAIRLQTSQAAAEVELTNATTDAATGYTYSVTETTAFGCGGGTSVIPSTALGAGAGTASLGSMANDDVRNFCFTVTAGPSIAQSTTTTAIWQFAATSAD